MDCPESINNHDIIIMVVDSSAKNLKLFHPSQKSQPQVIYIYQDDIKIDNVITLIDEKLPDYTSNNVLVIIMTFHSEIKIFLPPRPQITYNIEYLKDIVDKISLCSTNWKTLYPMCSFVWCLPYIPDFKRYNSKLHKEDYVPYKDEDILETEQVRTYYKLVKELKQILVNCIVSNTQVVDLNILFTEHISDREKYFENFVDLDKLPEFATGITYDGLHPLPALAALIWKHIYCPWNSKSKFLHINETKVNVEDNNMDKHGVAMLLDSDESTKRDVNTSFSNSFIPFHVRRIEKKFKQFTRRNAVDKVLSITKIPFEEFKENSRLELIMDNETCSNFSEIEKKEDSCANAITCNFFPAKGLDLKNIVTVLDNKFSEMLAQQIIIADHSNCTSINEISERKGTEQNDLADLRSCSLSSGSSAQQIDVADLGNSSSRNEISQGDRSQQRDVADLCNNSSRNEATRMLSMQQNDVPESSSKSFKYKRYKKKKKEYNVLKEIQFENCFDIYSKLIVKNGNEYKFVTPEGNMKKLNNYKLNEFKKVQSFYKSSHKTIDTIMNFHKARTGKQSNIVLVTDDREDFDVSLAGFHKRVDVVKIKDLSFLNAFTSIQRHPSFGKGTIFIFSCGVHDILQSAILPDCLASHCLFPQSTLAFAKGLNDSFSLVTKAIDLNIKILQNTTNDTALFCDFMLIPINVYNEKMALNRPCILNHPASKIPKKKDPHIKDKYFDTIDHYNNFIQFHALKLGYSPWDLQNTCRHSIKKKKEGHYKYSDDVYSFSPFLKEIRRNRAMELCEELILTLSSQPEDHQSHKFIAKDRISTESILVSDPIAPLNKPEISHQSTVSTVILPKNPSLVVRNVKYEQIVIITDVRYLPFLQHLNQDQVTILAHQNLEIEELEKYLPTGRNHLTRTTLYLLLLGIHSIMDTKQASACKRANCKNPMPIVKSLPMQSFISHLEKFVKSLEVALKRVQQSLPNHSAIALLPPLPITLLKIVHNHEGYHSKHAKYPLLHLASVLHSIFKTYPVWMKRMFKESSSSLNICGIEHQKEFDYLNVERYSMLTLYEPPTKKNTGTKHTYDDWKCFAYALIKKIISSMNKLVTPVPLMDVNIVPPDHSSSSLVPPPPVNHNTLSTNNKNRITVRLPVNNYGSLNTNMSNYSEVNLMQDPNIPVNPNVTIKSGISSVPNIGQDGTNSRNIDSIIKFASCILHSSNILLHQGIPSGPSGFDNIFLVGSRELICPLVECNAKSSMIYHEITNFDENDLEYLLYELGDFQEKSVCCLVFDISIITTKLMSSCCLKNSCRQPLFVTALRTENSKAMEEIEQTIAYKLQNILHFINSLSKYIHVIVLPLSPTKIYCEQVTSYYHQTNHIISNLGSHVVYGSESLWKRAVNALILGWNNIIKLTNGKYDSGNFFSSYLESNPDTFIILDNVTDVIAHWNEPDIWKAFAEIFFQSLVPMKINHKYNSSSNRTERVSVVVKHVSSVIPSAYFEELFNAVDPNANIIKLKDQYTVNGMTLGRANLLVEKLNNYHIGDTVLLASLMQQTGLVDTEFNLMQKLYNTFTMDKVYLKWKPQIIKNLSEKIEKDYDITSLKTSRCMMGSVCKGVNMCVYYHSPADKRRNPMLHSYSDVMCYNIKKIDDICRRDTQCKFSHNVFEIKFHPSKYQIRPCPSGETSEICNCQDGFCNYAHIDSPELFFTPNWVDLNVIGPQLSLKFLAGAIKTSLKIDLEQRCKLKLILISTSSEFLDIAITVSCDLIKRLGKKMGLKVCSLNSSSKAIASCQVLIGFPCELVNLDINKLGQLIGAVIVDDVRSIVKSDHHSSYLIQFFQMVKRSKNSNLNKVFVCSSQDSESSRAISELVGTQLKLVNLSNADYNTSDSSTVIARRPFFSESSDFTENKSDQFGLPLFKEYTIALEEMRQNFERDYQRYRINPYAYPKIKPFIEMYNKQYKQELWEKSDKSAVYKKKMWRHCWDSKFQKIKNSDWELAQKSLIEHFEGKIKQETSAISQMEQASHSAEQREYYSFVGTLSLMELLCDDLGFIGPCIEAMITACRETGPTTAEAYEIFVKSENVQVVNLALEKIKSLCQSATGKKRSLYEKAINWIPNLLDEAQIRLF